LKVSASQKFEIKKDDISVILRTRCEWDNISGGPFG